MSSTPRPRRATSPRSVHSSHTGSRGHEVRQRLHFGEIHDGAPRSRQVLHVHRPRTQQASEVAIIRHSQLAHNARLPCIANIA